MLGVHHIASGSTGNAILLTDGDTRILMDAGITIRQITAKYRVRVSQLAGVFITHEHGDHAKGVKDLLDRGVPVYASHGTTESLRVPDEHKKNIRTVRHFQQLSVGSFDIIPFNTYHDAMEPLGFVFRGNVGQSKGLYLTDSAYVPVRIKGLTHFIIECNYDPDELQKLGESNPTLQRRIKQSHMGLDDLVEFFKEVDTSKARQIILVHLSKERGRADKFIRTLQSQLGIPVRVLDPGELFEC